MRQGNGTVDQLAATEARLSGALAPIQGAESLADQAYLRLRSAILAGTLSAGQQFSVPDFARRLGVSRSPVREAVLRLAREGLVETQDNKGAVVATPAASDLREAYAVRAALDGLAASLAAEGHSDEELEILAATLDDHVKAVEQRDLELHIATDLHFHLSIATVSGNQTLRAFLDLLMARIRIGLRTTGRNESNRQQAMEDHIAILDAIRNSEPARARLLASAHVLRVSQSLASE